MLLQDNFLEMEKLVIILPEDILIRYGCKNSNYIKCLGYKIVYRLEKAHFFDHGKNILD